MLLLCQVQRLTATADEVPAAPMEARENGSRDEADLSTGQPEAEQTGSLDSAAHEGNQIDPPEKPQLGTREDAEARAKQAQAEAAELKQQLAELEGRLTAVKLRPAETASSQLQAQVTQHEELQWALELKAARERELEGSLANVKGQNEELLQLKQAFEVREKEAEALSQKISDLEAELSEARKHEMVSCLLSQSCLMTITSCAVTVTSFILTCMDLH